MDEYVTSAISHLGKLVAFETISALPNLDIVNYIQEQLQRHGIESSISYDETGKRANLHAIIGPRLDGGVLLNGHTDVVPVEGQDWFSDPFLLTNRDGRLYGRGSVDMKGYLACMIAAVPLWQGKALKKPIHVSMCYDEETGGFGAPVLVKDICENAPLPSVAIVGEPTEMQIVIAHKAGFEMRTEITGLEAHSSNPRLGVSAISCAVRFISFLLNMADDLAAKPHKDSPFVPNYTTLNIGTIEGGVARNTIAGNCAFDWEIRPLTSAHGKQLIAEITDYAMNTLLPEMRKTYPEANILIDTEADVPGLDHRQAERATKLISNITGLNSTHAVPFGTDAGHFAAAEISTIVMGPGSIEQAHKPDEFIEISQITECLNFFDKLGNELAR